MFALSALASPQPDHSMMLLSVLLLLLKDPPYPTGTGLEWLPIASVLLAVLFLVAVIWMGSRHTV